MVVAEIAQRTTIAPSLPHGKIELPKSARSTIFPVPVVLCGAMVEGRPNFNLLGNFGISSPERPHPVIYISTAAKHFTNKGIREHCCFSVNIPSPRVMDRADYCGVVSGKNVDKSKTFTVFYGREPDAPCIAECPVNYVCRVIRSFKIRAMEIFIGEIIGTFVSEACLDSGRIAIERVEPLIYTGDGKYRIPGAPVGNAYGEFKKYSP